MVCILLFFAHIRLVSQAREASSSRSGNQLAGTSDGWAAMQQSGSGWQTTVITYGDNGPARVVTLLQPRGSNPIGPEREGQSDLMRLLQDLQMGFSSPALHPGGRDFTEVAYASLLQPSHKPFKESRIHSMAWNQVDILADSLCMLSILSALKLLELVMHGVISVCGCRRTMRCCQPWTMRA